MLVQDNISLLKGILNNKQRLNCAMVMKRWVGEVHRSMLEQAKKGGKAYGSMLGPAQKRNKGLGPGGPQLGRANTVDAESEGTTFSGVQMFSWTRFYCFPCGKTLPIKKAP